MMTSVASRTAIRASVRQGRRTRAIRRTPGFSLIELMIVVAVIAILAAIVYPNYRESVLKSRRGQAKADLVEMAQILERRHTVQNDYSGLRPVLADSSALQHYTFGPANIAAGAQEHCKPVAVGPVIRQRKPGAPVDGKPAVPQGVHHMVKGSVGALGGDQERSEVDVADLAEYDRLTKPPNSNIQVV